MASAKSTAKPTATKDPDRTRPKRWRGGPVDGRRFMIGLEGVIVQAPPLRTQIVHIDPRYVGRSVALGGVGLFGRFRPRPVVGFDVSIRSGSLRYAARDESLTISHDQILADVGTLLYLGRGEVAQFALSGGIGGLVGIARYDVDGRGSGRQTFGAVIVRAGADAEFVVKRIAFVLSFRAYGVFTPRDRARSRGALFDGATAQERQAPVATAQTQLVGAAGIAYRF